MKKYIYIFLIVLSNIAFSQNQGKVWYFGGNAGLDFNTDPPTALLDNAFSTNEGCASISDSNGDLLFYTDGINAYNRNHQVMPNGITLGGNSSSSQSAIIVPDPANTDRYYIFAVSAYSNSNVVYSLVDMSLDGGNGEVLASVKAIPLLSGTTETIQATKSADGTFWWVVTQKALTNSFYAYRVTAAGVDVDSPVISSTGPVIPSSGDIGYIKFNTSNTKLVATNYISNFFSLCDFDNSTGVVSNAQVINKTSAYGAEFSPNGNLLYVGGFGQNIMQYDATLATQEETNASGVIVSVGSANFGALQSAPDGKIYIAKGQTFLDAITEPNNVGAACNYVSNAQDLAGRSSAYGLPNIISSFVSTGPPVLSDCSSSAVTATEAVISATISSDGGEAITQRGFYYGTTPNPTGNEVLVSGTTGTMSTTITGLTPETLYYFRGFATNSNGTSFVGDCTFTTAANSFTCAEVDQRNNGNGQASSCPGVDGTAVNNDVIGTTYNVVPTSTKTGSIRFRWTTAPSVVPVITNVWLDGIQSAAEVGPPSVTETSGGFEMVTYCFYNVNLPNAGSYTLEFTNPQTDEVYGRCTFTGNSDTPTTEPPLVSNTDPTITSIANQNSCTNEGLTSLSFTISDAEDTSDLLLVSASSSNQTVVTDAGVAITHSTDTVTVDVTPETDQVGSTTITLTVTDTNGGLTTTSFDYEVIASPALVVTNSICDTEGLQWINWDSVNGTTATGTIFDSTNVTVTHSLGGMSTTPSMFNHGIFPAEYNVPNSTTIRNDLAGTFTITFDNLISNPQVAFSSIGDPSTPVGINTSIPYEVIWVGQGVTYNSNTSLTGSEGFTIIRFPGEHTSITFEYLANEAYCNMAFGAISSNCSDLNLCLGNSVTLTASGGTAYLWSPSEGLDTTTGSQVVATPTVTTTYSVIDPNNTCSTPQTITITVDDTPPTASAIDYVIDTYDWSNGAFHMLVGYVNSGSTDNCSLSAVEVVRDDNNDGVADEAWSDRIVYSCSDLGVTNYLFRATDNSGNQTIISRSVTLEDNTSPTVVAQDFTVSLGADGTATVATTDIDNGSTDDCTIDSYSLDVSSFDCTNLGVNTVTLTVTDGSGNSSTGEAVVTVVDTLPPTVLTQDITVELDETGQASITADMIDNGSYDNCGVTGGSSEFIYFTGTSSGYIWKASKDGSTEPELLYTESYTAGPVGIEVDETAGLVYYGGGNNNVINVLDIENQTTSILPGSQQGSERHDFEIFDGYVYYTTDGDLIKADVVTGDTVILVEDSTYGDVIAGITLDRTNGVLYFIAQDNQWGIGRVDIDGNNIQYNYISTTGNARGVTIDESSQTLYWVEQNGANLWTSPADASTPPQLLYDMTSFGTGNGYHVDISGSDLYWVKFDGSTNDVIYKAPKDGSGPVSELYSGSFGGIRGIAAGRNILSSSSVSSVSLSIDIDSFDCTNLGVNTVTLTATDGSGNSSTGEAVVTVVDNIPPTITAPAAVSVNVDAASCEATGVDLGVPTITDNCEASTTSDAPALFPLGDTVVIWTVTDGSGNTATATQTVTVVDNILPTITAPAAVSVNVDAASCEATGVDLGVPTTADNCSVASTTSDAPAVFPLGDTVVTWTVTDGSGNTATATQTVTVVDNILPTITAPAAVTLDTNTDCTATGFDLGTPLTTDNCSIATVTNDAAVALPLGATTITWTVTDGSGNSATATQIVTVVDTVNPLAVSQDLLISLDEFGEAFITVDMIDNGSTDNCGIDSLEISETVFNCDNIGFNSVILTVTDNSGNISTTTATVTVVNTFGDNDGDGILDNCDDDDDNDGVADVDDNCPYTPNPDQADNDMDGFGDVCDDDDDDDGVLDVDDNCPMTYNPGQEDRDNDGLGDICDLIEINVSQALTPNGDGINDIWVIYNIENHPNNIVRVYNRWGNEVFSARGYQNNWDGRYVKSNGSIGSDRLLPEASSYYYQIDLDGNGTVDNDGWLYITK